MKLMNKKLINTMKAIPIIILIVITTKFFFAEPDQAVSILNDGTDSLRIIEPKNHFALENQMITTMLSRYHYKDFELNDSLSS